MKHRILTRIVATAVIPSSGDFVHIALRIFFLLLLFDNCARSGPLVSFPSLPRLYCKRATTRSLCQFSRAFERAFTRIIQEASQEQPSIVLHHFSVVCFTARIDLDLLLVII